MRTGIHGFLALSLAGCSAVVVDGSAPLAVEAPPGPVASLSLGPALTAEPKRLPVPPALSEAVLAGVPTGQITPAAEELLDRPIDLDGCPGVRIVEWRPLAGREATTGPSDEAVALLTGICRVAIAGFDGFVQLAVPFPVPFPADLRVDVSLLPMGDEGPIVRTLADHDGRFASRTKSYDEAGTVERIGGYAHWPSGFVFVRHDVLLGDGDPNERTLMIFAHELFHAMSWQSGLTMTHPPPWAEADERMARRFTEELGLGE